MKNKKIDQIINQFKLAVEEKYNISTMKLFGSSARGDYTEISDIDIMVKLPIVNRKIEEDLYNIAYELELEYDCLIDIIVLPDDIDNNIPIYTNIEKEGILIWI